MAQDATGTPTSLGIPKYNTAADAPSGKGFNAAMDAIDAIIVAKGLPAAPPTNGAVYWNGSAWTSAKLTDAQLDMTTIIPTGTITAFGGASAPGGWMICDGAIISRTTYAALFAVLGTAYGAGDGSTTFGLPNLKGRVPVGIDAGQGEFDVRGESGGAKTHTLSVAELATHSHGGSTGGADRSLDHLHYPAGNDGFFYSESSASFNLQFLQTGGSVLHGQSVTGSADRSLDHLHGLVIGNTGSNSAHNNLQPYQTVHYIVKF